MELGLRGDDWFITPLELEALIKRHATMRIDRLVPAAMICARMSNMFRDEKQKPEPFTVADFLPGEPKPKEPEMTAEERARRQIEEAHAAREQWRVIFHRATGK